MTGPIPLDQLVGGGQPVHILWLSPDHDLVAGDIRAPHRHDYHELFVLSDGHLTHRIDDQRIEHGPGSVLLIGRGQMHVLEHAAGARGAVVRFNESMLTDAAQQTSPGWMLVRARTCVLHPPASEMGDLEQLLHVLDGEMQRPRDGRTDTLESYYLSAVLLLIDRWQGAPTLDASAPQSSDMALFQEFARLLAAEYANHHDAKWYAEQLAVSPNHLAGVLTHLTGRSTKKLINDRVMTEAQRLLRHTSLTAQQIAFRLGYEDPLYFSRVFRQHVGQPPSQYRRSTGSGND